jgi:hypothetical protein
MAMRAFAMVLMFALCAHPQSRTSPPVVPKFSDYIEDSVFRGTPAPPNIATKRQQLFRTQIHRAAKKGPNFAGRYTIARWGCGVACVMFAITDAASGVTYDPPFNSVTTPPARHGEIFGELLNWRANSSLLVVDGCIEGEVGCASFYYEWNGERLVLLHKTPKVAKPAPYPRNLQTRPSSVPGSHGLWFSDFPVREIYTGVPAPAKIRRGELFRTRIREGAEEGPNFAGHYTITKWGCGTGCFSFVITDAITGVTYYPPISIVGLGHYLDPHQGLDFVVDSRLLILDGCPEDRDCATHYYKWERNRLMRLKRVPNPKGFPGEIR